MTIKTVIAELKAGFEELDAGHLREAKRIFKELILRLVDAAESNDNSGGWHT